MSRGFDQYLANRLNGQHVFQIVTDPKLADAVLTDQIGEPFEARLAELYPPPEPPTPPKPAKEEEKAKSGDKAGDKKADAPKGAKSKDAEDDTAASALITDTVNKLAPPTSQFGRARGIVFLVDPRSKEVLWSWYDMPRGSSADDLDRTAADIAGRIKRDLTGKKK
jgi:hypothetical protein